MFSILLSYLPLSLLSSLPHSPLNTRVGLWIDANNHVVDCIRNRIHPLTHHHHISKQKTNNK